MTPILIESDNGMVEVNQDRLQKKWVEIWQDDHLVEFEIDSIPQVIAALQKVLDETRPSV
jgi:hypothetical protein